jgi:Na+-translocating ferredoxin:NAD+ oxidoreductase subunit G
MAKKETTLLQLVLSLCLISIVAAAGLAAVYTITKEPISISQKQKKIDAIKSVLSGFNGQTKESKILLPNEKDTVIVNLAYNENRLFGAAVETYTDKAFKGTFTLMVGFDSLGNIIGTEVLSANETPGLGDKIDKKKDKNFSAQFLKKNPKDFNLKVKKDGGDVDAITAATISSRAYCDALKRAYSAFIKAKEVSNE